MDQRGVRDNGNGGGSWGGGIEARLAKLESDVGHIQSDISDIKTDIREVRNSIGKQTGDLHSGNTRILYTFGAGVVFLLGVFAWGYARLADQGDRVSSAVSDMRVAIQQVVDAVVPKRK